MRVPAWLWPTDFPDDGVGQSLLEDVRYIWRFMGCWQRTIVWRAPDVAERKRYDEHPLFGRFGDDTIAIADIDGRRWIVRERLFYGWPDPPRYVFFALEAADRIWSGADFHQWPRAWTMDASPQA